MSLAETGYQIFPRLVAPDQIAAARAAALALCQRHAPTDARFLPLDALPAHRHPGLSGDTWRKEVFLLSELPGLSEDLRDFVLLPDLWRMAEEVLGGNDVVYHFSNVTRKPPHVGPNITWHRDFPNHYICPQDSRAMFRALIPLEQMNEENGVTEALPGSHLISDSTAMAEEKKRDYDLAMRQALDSSPGDVIAIDSKLVHGGRENRSARERNLIVIQFGRRTDQFFHRVDELFTGLSRSEILQTLSR